MHLHQYIPPLQYILNASFKAFLKVHPNDRKELVTWLSEHNLNLAWHNIFHEMLSSFNRPNAKPHHLCHSTHLEKFFYPFLDAIASLNFTLSVPPSVPHHLYQMVPVSIPLYVAWSVWTLESFLTSSTTITTTHHHQKHIPPRNFINYLVQMVSVSYNHMFSSMAALTRSYLRILWMIWCKLWDSSVSL